MSPINPGVLRHRVRITNPGTDTTDEGGGLVPGAPVSGQYAWARIRPLSTSERLRAMQADASLTHEITMRHRADVTAETNVEFGARTFRVVGPPIDREERGELLRFLAVEDT